METINVYTLLQVREKEVPYDIDHCVAGSPEAAVALINRAYQLDQRATEHFGVLALNAQLQPTGLHLTAIGGIGQCYVAVPALLQAGLLNNASALIAFHNHPAGTMKISDDDIQLTLRLRDACDLVGITLHDHIVITETGFISLRSRELF